MCYLLRCWTAEICNCDLETAGSDICGYHPGQWRCSNHWITFCWRALLSWEPALSYNLSLILLLEWENRQLEKGALRRGLHMGSGNPISPRNSGKQQNSHLRIRLSQMSWNWHIPPCFSSCDFLGTSTCPAQERTLALKGLSHRTGTVNAVRVYNIGSHKGPDPDLKAQP